MKWNKHWLLPINLVIILGLYNYSICSKEKLLATGKSVYLQLAPVDPRSLMQGDYMRLSFAMDSIRNDSLPKRGFFVVKTDSRGLVIAARSQSEPTPLQSDEQLIRYTTNFNGIQLGAESYFFQEGTAEKYASARYGLIRVDRAGNTLLVGLCDSTLRKL